MDKGTLDAVDCGSTSDGQGDNFKDVVKVAREVHRILKTGGIWLIVTSRSKAKRLEFLQEFDLAEGNEGASENDGPCWTTLFTKCFKSGKGKGVECRLIVLKALHPGGVVAP